MTFTPKGLFVNCLAFKISSLDHSPPGHYPAAIMPRPPAFETAAASSAVAIQAILPWMIGVNSQQITNFRSQHDCTFLKVSCPPLGILLFLQGDHNEYPWKTSPFPGGSSPPPGSAYLPPAPQWHGRLTFRPLLPGLNSELRVAGQDSSSRDNSHRQGVGLKEQVMAADHGPAGKDHLSVVSIMEIPLLPGSRASSSPNNSFRLRLVTCSKASVASSLVRLRTSGMPSSRRSRRMVWILTASFWANSSSVIKGSRLSSARSLSLPDALG